MTPETLSARPVVILRADGGADIGGGHVVRAKVIAGALASIGFVPHLLTRENDWARQVLRDTGFAVQFLRKTDNESLIVRKTADRLGSHLVVLDVRDTSPEYVRYLKESNRAVITIDDDGRGADLADATFRGGANPKREKNYYYGPAYAILSPDILEFRKRSHPPAALLSVVCFLGTFDPRGHGKLIPPLAEAFPKISFAWFADRLNVLRGNLQLLKGGQREFFERMVSADAAIVSGGVTLFETAALGRPAIVLPQAPHEIDQANLFSAGGAALALERPTAETLRAALADLSEHPDRLGTLHVRGMEMVDGQGIDRFLQVVRSILG